MVNLWPEHETEKVSSCCSFVLLNSPVNGSLKLKLGIHLNSRNFWFRSSSPSTGHLKETTSKMSPGERKVPGTVFGHPQQQGTGLIGDDRKLRHLTMTGGSC